MYPRARALGGVRPALAVQRSGLRLSSSGVALGLALSGLTLFYLGVLGPAFEPLGLPEAGTRLLRHAYLAPMGLAFVLLVLAFPAPLRRLGQPFETWLIGILAACVFMLVHGLIRQAELSVIVLDAGNYMTFAVAVLLGARPQSWPLLDKFLRATLYIATGLVFIEIAQFETASRSETTSSVAYTIQAATFALPYVFFTLDKRKGSEKVLIALAFLVAILANVLFQKRAPIARLAIMLLLLLFAVRSSGLSVGRWRSLAGGVGFLLAAGAALYGLAQEDDERLVAESSTLLTERFRSPGGVEQLLVTENDRVAEAGYLLEDLSDGPELFYGMGFGGSFRLPASWVALTMDVEVAGQTEPRKYRPHIGLLAPLLKGGVLLWLLLFGGWVAALRAAWKMKQRDPVTTAAGCTLLLMLMFMTIESLWGPANILQTALAGLCVGRCASRHSVWRKPVAADGLTPSIPRSS